MLRDKIYIAEIGLSDTDLRLIETAFKSNEQLKKSYVLNLADLSLGADIVMLNIDSVVALEEWDLYEDKGHHAVLINITSDSHKEGDGITVCRPLSMKKIVNAVEVMAAEIKKKAEKAKAEGAQGDKNTDSFRMSA